VPELTKSVIDALKPRADGKDLFVWDSGLPGFAVRMKKGGSFAYVIQYKNDRGQTRRLKVAGQATAPAKAHAMAKLLLAQVEAGGDPSRDRLIVLKMTLRLG
jgi:hypothetical protein